MAKRRRGHGDGSIYQRKDGLWAAVLDLGWSNGRRQRKTAYAKTRKGATAKLQAMQRDNQAGVLATKAPTVEAWLHYWLEEVARERVRPATLSGYSSKIDRYAVPLLGHHRLDKLQPAHLRAAYKRLTGACPDRKCEHQPRHGLSDATARQLHAILHRALTVAVREGKVATNAADKLDPPSMKSNRRRPLTVAEARTVLDATDNARWWAALYLGMRQGEALGLTWDRVDLHAGTLTIDRALQRVKGKGLVMVAPKSTASHRTIPIPTVVLSRLTVAYAEHLRDGGDPYAYVWGRDKGEKPQDPRADWQEWTDLLRAADVPHTPLHAARNTTASLLEEAGVPDRIVAVILGHSAVTMTHRYQASSELPRLTEAMRALEAHLSQ